MLQRKVTNMEASHRAVPVQTPQTTTGFLSLLPKSWVPYAQLMRLDRPAGLYAFYFPYLMGVNYAACLSPQSVTISQVFQLDFLFLAWCVILRGWTCTCQYT